MQGGGSAASVLLRIGEPPVHRVMGGVLMRARSRSLLFTIALVIALYLVWRKVRIIFIVPLTPWQLALVLLIIAVVIFLLLDHLFNRTR